MALAELLRLGAVPESAEVANRLLQAHLSVGAIFASLPNGVSPALVRAPKALRVLEAARTLMLASLKTEIALAPLENGKAVVDYLRGSMAFARQEMLRVLYLDGQNRLILDEPVHCGSRAGVYLPAPHIVRRAAALDASGILLAHNHPSGNPRPSTSDRLATRSLAARLSAIGVTLHDHMIFARSGWVSLRALGLIPDSREEKL